MTQKTRITIALGILLFVMLLPFILIISPIITALKGYEEDEEIL